MVASHECPHSESAPSLLRRSVPEPYEKDATTGTGRRPDTRHLGTPGGCGGRVVVEEECLVGIVRVRDGFGFGLVLCPFPTLWRPGLPGTSFSRGTPHYPVSAKVLFALGPASGHRVGRRTNHGVRGGVDGSQSGVRHVPRTSRRRRVWVTCGTTYRLGTRRVPREVSGKGRGGPGGVYLDRPSARNNFVSLLDRENPNVDDNFG